ncbi:diacylglycerol/lipid kinase family protein [Compostimonas suwonensis]|uniref:Diacylglycerol kinase family enzyme n=1 Tax=Compostimonas suwonensis TaxID=1048394 RepID=A0A2M9C0E0_9MICO|nr:diacylglycerol kinase family protein [Compostimonas suwonensis]PJJ63798.1 diacylglycerol kinase family enzyme [Compostimonas suwonensis]
MTAQQRIAIVWNPSKTTKEELEAALHELEPSEGALDPEWYETSTEDAGQGPAAAAADAGASLIVAAGGDGTVRAVAEYLAESGSGAELGIVPLGTGNLLARNLGVPIGDVPAAFTRALTSAAKPFDVGWADIDLVGGTERHAFVVMAGFGIDAHMITETDDELKAKAGWLAYVESLGRAVAASDVIDLRLGLDGGAAEDISAHTLIVGNCGTIQGGITLLPDADPADGELDLLILNADGIAGWADTARNMIWDNGIKRLITGGDTAESSESSTHRRAATVEIELSEPRMVEIDGEDIGEGTRVSITTQAGAVRIRS